MSGADVTAVYVRHGGDIEQQGDCILRDGRSAVGRDVADGDARPAGRVEIDHVVAGAKGTGKTQGWTGFEHPRVEPQPVDENSFGRSDAFDRLFRRRVVIPFNFECIGKRQAI